MEANATRKLQTPETVRCISVRSDVHPLLSSYETEAFCRALVIPRNIFLNLLISFRIQRYCTFSVYYFSKYRLVYLPEFFGGTK
jgi:hypothetical protein